MGVFGDRLRREREMRGVTLEEISESTKISRRSLQALEDEQFDNLPGGIFNKGFVRAYARYLGIDEDQAVADYVSVSNEQPAPEDQFPLEIHEGQNTRQPPLNPRRSFLPMTIAVVALVLGVGGWTYWVKFRPQVIENSELPASTPPGAQNSAAPQVSPPSTQSTAAPAANQDQAASTDASSTTSDSTDEAASSGDQSAPELKPFTVSVKVKQDSWVRIVADGRTVVDGMMQANDKKSVKAGKQLVLRTGNAAGIEVSYRGRPLGSLGEEGKPRTLTFNSSGLQQ